MTNPQRGFMLIEAMIAILIFSLAILGMVAMGGTAVGAQSDARYRTDAANLASDIASQIALNVDRSSPNSTPSSISNSLGVYQHLETEASPCVFSGTASTVAAVQDWATKVETTGPGLPGLPGSGPENQQILVNTDATGFNRVQITICWKAPADTALRRHTLVSYVN